MSDKNYQDRIESEARAAKQITNDDLVCKDCIFKDHPKKKTVMCLIYNRKPNEVLLGGECDRYVKEDPR